MVTYTEFMNAKNKFLEGHEYTVEHGSICDGGILTERYVRDDFEQFCVDIESERKDGFIYRTYEYWSTTFDKSYYAHTMNLEYRLHAN